MAQHEALHVRDPLGDPLAVVRRYLEGWATGDAAIFEEVLAPDFYDVMYGQRRDRMTLIAQAQGNDFDDRSVSIDEAVVLGETVVVRTTHRHRHVASGRRVTISGIIWARVVDGKITTGWGEHDRLGQLQQLGVVPSGAEAQAWIRERLLAASASSGTHQPAGRSAAT
jgi:ketosteroid isomerase-like protein